MALCKLLAVLTAVCLANTHGAPWNVLVLGGSGFIGHLTTERLLREGHKVTVLSRGYSYWNIMQELTDRGAVHWRCNRTLALSHGGGKLADSSGLVNCSHLKNSTDSFDAVVDFSSRSLEELRQVTKLLQGRIGLYVFISTHAVYDVSKNTTHGEPLLLESDAVRPGREVSPLERFNLKEKNTYGDHALEIEEDLVKQFNSGGAPFVALRIANVIGPKENTIRYWLLHLWVRAHVALTMPMQLDDTLLKTGISMTYTPDIAQAVVRVIARSRGEVCCPEKVQGEVFNLASEQAPTQRELYNHVAEPIRVPYIETQEVPVNKSVVLYPDVACGPVNAAKAMDVLRWSPTDLAKAIRSVALFYDRVMIDNSKKYKKEKSMMFDKVKRMLGKEGPRFIQWITKYYDDRRKTELYDELDDEDEDDILLSRPDPEKRKTGKRRRKSGKDSEL